MITKAAAKLATCKTSAASLIKTPTQGVGKAHHRQDGAVRRVLLLVPQVGRGWVAGLQVQALHGLGLRQSARNGLVALGAVHVAHCTVHLRTSGTAVSPGIRGAHVWAALCAARPKKRNRNHHHPWHGSYSRGRSSNISHTMKGHYGQKSSTCRAQVFGTCDNKPAPWHQQCHNQSARCHQRHSQ